MPLKIENKPFIQLGLLLISCFISVLVFSGLGASLAAFIYHFELRKVGSLSTPALVEGMKMIQLFSAVGLFIVPPLLLAYLTSIQPLQTLGLKSLSKLTNYLLVLLLMVVLSPFLSWLIELNEAMVLPDFMRSIEQWMRHSEQQAERVIKAMLTFDGVGSLAYVLLIVAVVPALGEELLFRAVLQKITINWTKNAHLGIWLAAFVFSAIHLQFFGFFPRLLLGLLLGYIFYWTGSLWLPILGHFINNGTVVVLSYYYPERLNETSDSFLNGGAMDALYILASALTSMAILFFIWKLNTDHNPSYLGGKDIT